MLDTSKWYGNVDFEGLVGWLIDGVVVVEYMEDS